MTRDPTTNCNPLRPGADRTGVVRSGRADAAGAAGVDGRADLRQFSTRDLDDIAERVNTRPRRVLDWATSAELFLPRVRAEYASWGMVQRERAMNGARRTDRGVASKSRSAPGASRAVSSPSSPVDRRE